MRSASIIKDTELLFSSYLDRWALFHRYSEDTAGSDIPTRTFCLQSVSFKLNPLTLLYSAGKGAMLERYLWLN